MIVTADLSGMDSRTGKESEYLGKIKRVFQLIKESNKWKIWRYIPIDFYVFESLKFAKNKESRNQIIKAHREHIGKRFVNDMLSEGKMLAQNGKFAEAESLADIIVELADATGDKSLLTQHHLLRASIAGFQSQYKKALEEAQIALNLHEGDVRGRIYILMMIGYTYLSDKQFDKAIAHYIDTLKLVRAENSADRRDESIILINIAAASEELGRLEDVIQYSGQALSLMPNIGDRVIEGDANLKLAKAYANLGQSEKALEYYKAASMVYHSIPDKRNEGFSLYRIAIIYAGIGSFDKAIPYYEQALAITRELNDKPSEGEVLHFLGLAYSNLHQHEKSAGYFKLALPIYRDMNNRQGEAEVLMALGKDYRHENKNDEAVKHYEMALAIWRERADRPKEAQALDELGMAYAQLSNYNKALEYYVLALAIKRASNDKLGEADTLSNMGLSYVHSANYTKAIECFEKASVIYHTSTDKVSEGDTLADLGTAYLNQGQYDKAVVAFEQALPLIRMGQSKWLEAGLFNYLGISYQHLLNYQKAIENLERSLALYRSSNDKVKEGKVLTDLAMSYLNQGQYNKVIVASEQALPLLRQGNDQQGEAAALSYLGISYLYSPDFAKAVKYFEQSLAIYRSLQDKVNEGAVLRHLARTYYGQGYYDKAVVTFEEALPLLREESCHCKEESVLNDLGQLYHFLGRYDKAAENHEKALAINRQKKEPLSEAETLNFLGDIYRHLFQQKKEPATLKKALTTLENALAIYQNNRNRSGQASVLGDIGLVYSEEGDFKKAIDLCRKSADIYGELGDRFLQGNVFYHLGYLYRKAGKYKESVRYHERSLVLMGGSGTANLGRGMGDLMLTWKALNKPRLAIFYGKQAINAFQEVRGNIQKLDKETQDKFLSSNEEIYSSLIDLLVSEGRLAEAQQVLELLKEEEHSDFVRRQSEQPSSQSEQAGLAPKEAEWEKRFREISANLADISIKYNVLSAKQSLTEYEVKLRDRYEKDLEVANKAFKAYIKSMTEDFKKTGRLGVPPEIISKIARVLRQALQQIGPKTVALYTVLTKEKYIVIVITPDMELAREYPINIADLNRLVMNFRQALRKRDESPLPAAQDLYNILIAPIANDLTQYGADTLLWSLYGILRYIPIAALYDGNQYMVERYNNVVITPVSLNGLTDKPSSEWTGVGMGVSKAHDGFIPLPSVPEELKGIIRDGSDPSSTKGILPGTIMLNDAFTKDKMKTALRRKPSLVHIASHFKFKPGNDADSFLLMGDGYHLTLAEIDNAVDLFKDAQLLTLSACDTALGSGDGNGTEIESFGVIAQGQGAKAVVASLWSVADESTSLLMREFYQLRELNSALTKAEALRQAQLAALKGKIKSEAIVGNEYHQSPSGGSKNSNEKQVFTPDPNAPYSHPFYWAPFILIGNFR